jgi:hypothetical protein
MLIFAGLHPTQKKFDVPRFPLSQTPVANAVTIPVADTL